LRKRGSWLVSLIKISNNFLIKYKEHVKNDRPFIVGIDGLGGAGKTTVALKLKEDLKNKGYDVITIHLDDYIVESNKRYKTGYEEWHEYYYLQWDIKSLQKELFQAVYDGEQLIRLPLYDKRTDTVTTKKVYITLTSIVLIEGVFIQRWKWRKYFDFVIFIDCPFKERAKRVLNRDVYIGDYQNRLTKYQKRYWAAEEKYIEMEIPKEKADIIYNSVNPR